MGETANEYRGLYAQLLFNVYIDFFARSTITIKPAASQNGRIAVKKNWQKWYVLTACEATILPH